MPFWAGDTDLRQVVSSQFRGAFSLSRAVYRAPARRWIEAKRTPSSPPLVEGPPAPHRSHTRGGALDGAVPALLRAARSDVWAVASGHGRRRLRRAVPAGGHGAIRLRRRGAAGGPARPGHLRARGTDSPGPA